MSLDRRARRAPQAGARDAGVRAGHDALAAGMLRLASACCALSAAITLLASVGLIFGVGVLSSFIPGQAPTKPNSILAALLGSVGVGLLVRRTAAGAQRLRIALGLLLLLLALATLVEYVTGESLGIDRLLPAGAHAAYTSAPGRMAPTTALAFALCGVAILIFRAGSRRAVLASWAGVLVLALGIVTLIGYGAHMNGYLDAGAARMSLPSSLGCVLLGLGLALSAPDRGALALAARSGPAGHMFRRLLPVALLAPPLIGLVSWAGRGGARYSSDFGILIMISLIVCVMVLAIVSAAHALDTAEAQRRAAELELELQSRVAENLTEGVAVVRWSDDTLIYANRRLSEMMGAPPGTLVGERCRRSSSRPRIRGGSRATPARSCSTAATGHASFTTSAEMELASGAR